MARNPRSLHTLAVYYNPLNAEGKYIQEWILRQSNVQKAVRELVLLYGAEYEKWKEEHPEPEQEKITFYQRRRLAGLCVKCGKPAYEKSRCPDCLEKLRKRAEITKRVKKPMSKVQPKKKWWKIQSPGGTIYECDGLKDWLKEHAEMFDGTIEQAYDAFVRIKYSLQGKRTKKTYQWKGWRLLEWSDY